MTFEFIAGNTALDFVATVAERTTSAVERVPTPTALSAWFVAAGIVDTAPAVDGEGYERAISLRESIWDLLLAARDGATVSSTPRAEVNRWAAASPAHPELAADGAVRDAGDLSACLSSIARAAIDALRPDARARIKWCEGPRCTRTFLDESRGGNRRWCGMAGCGDRAKSAAYRARKRRSTATRVSE